MHELGQKKILALPSECAGLAEVWTENKDERRPPRPKMPFTGQDRASKILPSCQGSEDIRSVSAGFYRSRVAAVASKGDSVSHFQKAASKHVATTAQAKAAALPWCL